MESPVLQQLKIEKLPPPEIACRECQYATWMEFKAGPKCYCAVTQAWMYETGSLETKWVLNCDKQMEEPAEETVVEVKKKPEYKYNETTTDFGLLAATESVTNATEADFMKGV